jgi:hypothetical protein
MNTQRLTVGQLIDELSKFNPDAFIVTYNFNDNVELDLSWSNGLDYETKLPRDIDKEKREATHVTIDFIVNGKINFNEH